MSHRSVSTQQFGEQLQLFMTPEEIVERANKGDSFEKENWSPQEQWHRPGGASGYAGKEHLSLAEKKKQDLQPGGSHHKRFARGIEHMEPVTLQHGRLGKDAPLLSEGHHRLAYAEMHGVPFVNVEHSLPSQSWQEMRNVMSEQRAERARPKPPTDYPPVRVVKMSEGGTIRTDHYHSGPGCPNCR